LRRGEKILVVAEDDDSYSADHYPAPLVMSPERVDDRYFHTEQPQHLLLMGWPDHMHDKIKQLDSFLKPGSTLTLMNMVPMFEREERLREGGLEMSMLENLTVHHEYGNTVLKRHLQRLPVHTYNLIIILADESYQDDTQTSDSRTLTSMLLLRELVKSEYLRRDRELTGDEIGELIFSEVLDPQTRSLIQLAEISNYVMSNDLISSVLAQVSENRGMNGILQYLMAADGSEVYIKSARMFAAEDEDVNFWGIMSRARSMGACAIGYRLAGAEPHGHFEVTHRLNPPDRDERRKWSEQDQIIVIAED
jgi:hypothetical protein